ncbi:unnamed protein product [Pleuronectes platessa]|uniref:Uncharacterized protein n=1 Tax=Pleuronectes platessa TaxID=8262 RepID=A0A9N7YIF0_PLEPL|nr:unnamed protein product [Pleuronectes platessa]
MTEVVDTQSSEQPCTAHGEQMLGSKVPCSGALDRAHGLHKPPHLSACRAEVEGKAATVPDGLPCCQWRGSMRWALRGSSHWFLQDALLRECDGFDVEGPTAEREKIDCVLKNLGTSACASCQWTARSSGWRSEPLAALLGPLPCGLGSHGEEPNVLHLHSLSSHCSPRSPSNLRSSECSLQRACLFTKSHGNKHGEEGSQETSQRAADTGTRARTSRRARPHPLATMARRKRRNLPSRCA